MLKLTITWAMLSWMWAKWRRQYTTILKPCSLSSTLLCSTITWGAPWHARAKWKKLYSTIPKPYD
jgi:hypothetical protein